MLLHFLFLLVEEKGRWRDGDFQECFSFLKCLSAKSWSAFPERINLNLNWLLRQVLGLRAESVSTISEKREDEFFLKDSYFSLQQMIFPGTVMRILVLSKSKPSILSLPSLLTTLELPRWLIGSFPFLPPAVQFFCFVEVVPLFISVLIPHWKIFSHIGQDSSPYLHLHLLPFLLVILVYFLSPFFSFNQPELYSLSSFYESCHFTQQRTPSFNF